MKWHSCVISIPLRYGRGSDGMDCLNRRERTADIACFNDADIDRIREIKSWIDNGVQVGKVKSLLSQDDPDTQHLWREQQKTLLRLLQRVMCSACAHGSKSRVAIIRHRPHRPSFHSAPPTPAMPAIHLQALLSMLDGVLINYIAVCLPRAKNKPQRCAGGRLERARHHPTVAGSVDCHPTGLARGCACALPGAAQAGLFRRPDAAGLVWRSAVRHAATAADGMAREWLSGLFAGPNAHNGI